MVFGGFGSWHKVSLRSSVLFMLHVIFSSLDFLALHTLLFPFSCDEKEKNCICCLLLVITLVSRLAVDVVAAAAAATAAAVVGVWFFVYRVYIHSKHMHFQVNEKKIIFIMMIKCVLYFIVLQFMHKWD